MLDKLPPKSELPSSQRAKSWRDVLPVHPAADLFPMMSPAELRELGADIKKNGLRVAVAVFKQQKHFPPVLLDGRNRLAAMEAADIGIRAESAGSHGDPQIKLWFRLTDKDPWSRIEIVEVRGDHDDGNPFEYVTSANIHRRHLTADDKRKLVAKLIKQQPNKSDRQIAEQAKSNRTTVGQIRKGLEDTGDVSIVDTRTDSRGRQQPASKAPKIRAEKAAPVAAPEKQVLAAQRPPEAMKALERLSVEANEAQGLTSARQDQILHLVIRLLKTVDHPHQKKFYKYYVSNCHRGILLSSCSHVGWKSGGFRVDQSFPTLLCQAAIETSVGCQSSSSCRSAGAPQKPPPAETAREAVAPGEDHDGGAE
jgi:hypothetical protein